MIKYKFIGIWKLKQMYTIKDGIKNYPLGKNLLGRIIYFENNQMSAQGQGLDFEANNSLNNNVSKYVSGNYFGYFGSYTINEDAGTITHHVEGNVKPDVIGQDLVRYYAIHNNILELQVRTDAEVTTVVWEKMH
jgi:hypothetical protein